MPHQPPPPLRRVMVAINDFKFVFPLKFTLPLCRLQLTTFNPAFYSLAVSIRPFKTLLAGRPLLVTRAALLKPTHDVFLTAAAAPRFCLWRLLYKRCMLISVELLMTLWLKVHCPVNSTPLIPAAGHATASNFDAAPYAVGAQRPLAPALVHAVGGG